MATRKKMRSFSKRMTAPLPGLTYLELHKRVCKMANGLKSLGHKKGDRVVIYMAMSAEAIIAMQACARIGATHSVVFGGFSAPSLAERIENAALSPSSPPTNRFVAAVTCL